MLSSKSMLWASFVASAWVLCAQAQEPVLEWSARIGPPSDQIAGIGLLSDRSSVIVARRSASEVPGTGGFRNPDIAIIRVSADGGAVICESIVGGTRDDSPVATAIATDDTVLVAGSTNSPDFPVTPGALQTSFTGNGFLARFDSCGKVLYATYLPRGLAPSALVAGTDGTAYVIVRTEAAGRSQILKIDPRGAQILAVAEWNGLAGAAEMDSLGRLYVVGMRDSKACLTRFSADLKEISFDVAVGDGPLTMGTALAVEADGSSWIAGAAVPPGSVPTNRRSLPSSPLPFYDHTAVTLTRVGADGTIVFHRYVDMPDIQVVGGYRRSVKA